jgi:hypothetical protein
MPKILNPVNNEDKVHGKAQQIIKTISLLILVFPHIYFFISWSLSSISSF